jgi:hypothetical protein
MNCATNNSSRYALRHMLAIFTVALTQQVVAAPLTHMKKTPTTIAQVVDQPPGNRSPKLDGRHDFDFLVGHWKVRNRRLARRLENCMQWEEFAATNESRPLLGGLANLDRYEAVFPNGKPAIAFLCRTAAATPPPSASLLNPTPGPPPPAGQ